MGISEWVSGAPERLRARMNRAIRDAAGLSHEPPAICDDPAIAYTPVDGVARLVHGDLPSMMIGGLASLFFEMLHPHSMAGVAQHSRYREDALGRVLQTANFIGDTTFGSKPRAQRAINRVKAIHERVRGVADDGVAYSASDPHLLLWIHCAGTLMFLRAYQRFGATPISTTDADRYVAEVAQIARDLGAVDPPTSVAELEAALEAFRPEMRLSVDGATARDFISRGVVDGFAQRLAYRLLVESAFDLQPPWARSMLGAPRRSAPTRAATRVATSALSWATRLAVPPAVRQVASESPPSTTST